MRRAAWVLFLFGLLAGPAIGPSTPIDTAHDGTSVAAAQSDDVRVYRQPRYDEYRLDWCLEWGKNCGRPAADTFCRNRRFEGAREFSAEPPGTAGATKTLISRQVCNAPFCTAFASITCEKPIPSERVFANPSWKGRRLDVCLQWGQNCGRPAADAFCRAQGFEGSFHERVDPEPGRSTNGTHVIGTGQICNQPFCTGFQMIICR